MFKIKTIRLNICYYCYVTCKIILLIRVVVHEPGTYPDLEREGLHVEPGKLNEINYRPVLWKRLHTSQNPCRQDHIDQNPELAKITNRPLSKSSNIDYAYSYTDLNVSYRYTQSQCILLHQQEDIIKQCGCQYIYNPRPIYPTFKIPYCGSLLHNPFNITALANRIDCLSGPLNVTVRRNYERTMCHPRCTYYTYESTISVTNWRAVDWQLHWLRLLNQAFKSMQHEKKLKNKDNWNASESAGFSKWIEYYTQSNLTNVNFLLFFVLLLYLK